MLRVLCLYGVICATCHVRIEGATVGRAMRLRIIRGLMTRCVLLGRIDVVTFALGMEKEDVVARLRCIMDFHNIDSYKFSQWRW